MDKITEQLNILPPDYRDFVLSPFSGAIAESIRAQYELSAVDENDVQDGILLFLLFLLTEKGLVSFFERETSLSREDAVAAVDATLALLPDDFPWELVTDSNLSDEISALEETVSRLEPLRTMASDMRTHEQELAHTSNQSDLLSQRAAGPGWETDNGT